MKKVFWFLVPILIATMVFFGILFFLDRKSGKGALQVTSTPQSKVYLDNKLIGTTKFCACDISQMPNVGEYTIKLVPLGGNFRPFEEKITISKGTLTVVDRTFLNNGESEGSVINLIPLDNKKDIEVLVLSMPDKANVFLDNNPVGETPLLLKQVSESDHDLRITRSGYKEQSLKIKTALGYKLSSLIFLGINNDLENPITASPTATLTPAAVPKVLILDTPTGFLRVRKSNSLTSAEIAKIKPGESYELISEQEGWFEIKLADDIIGWISSIYAVKQ